MTQRGPILWLSQLRVLSEFYRVAVVTFDFLIGLVCVYFQHHLLNMYGEPVLYGMLSQVASH